MSLSMNSILGITGGRTIKLVGKVKGEEVLVMIDSRASHNFISTSLVDKMALPKVKTSSYMVRVGDGHLVKSEGSVNWQQLTMKYKIGEEMVCLKGDSSLARIEVSYKIVMRSIKKGGQGFLIKRGMMEAHVKTDKQVTDAMQHILKEF
ncbi:Retrovirus-related Pol polyprotein from transposon 17.6 [Senna tora]|uniref:Retrovirus-related Pol polyprotein from transposon 17.6 n=1 Tax=Senna tora TaxID=362788 RepID=A0A834SF97_9FABA|nr:Retrovirus-related Pol polyprotein from transposon 17.6 [Senna tora]